MIRVRFQNENDEDVEAWSDVWVPESPHVDDVVVFESFEPGVRQRTLNGIVKRRMFFAFGSNDSRSWVKPDDSVWPTMSCVVLRLGDVREHK